MPISASDVTLDSLRPGDAGWLIMRHAELYAAEEGFDARFEPVVARILTAYMEGHDPALERGWIARSGGRRLGSIFCVRGPEPGWRGCGCFSSSPLPGGWGSEPGFSAHAWILPGPQATGA
jgi:hypothetical protein